MPDFIGLAARPLPAKLLGSEGHVSIRLLTLDERIAAEDRIFATTGRQIQLDSDSTAIVVSDAQVGKASLWEFKSVVEFAMAILSRSGFDPLYLVALFEGGKCLDATRVSTESSIPGVYGDTIDGEVVASWLGTVFNVRAKTRDRLHVTADRFVRYCKAKDPLDGLVDLCISLESLLDVQQEIAFRFSTCLAKVTGNKSNKAQEVADTLSLLYSVRSKVVHGNDPTKTLGKLKPKLSSLRSVARAILTEYVFHLVNHSKEEWKQYLEVCLFE